MPEPLKRTNLRSSPEDAAFYRQFHDHALSALRSGTPREQLLKDLADKGVPEKTAARIVIAVGLELSAASGATGGGRPKVWKAVAFILLIWGIVAAYLAWRMTKDGTFSLKYLIAGGVIVLILSARVMSRLLPGRREPIDLPPPPDPK